MTKRPDGALEHDILAVLWAADSPLQPSETAVRPAASVSFHDRLAGIQKLTRMAVTIGPLAAALVGGRVGGRPRGLHPEPPSVPTSEWSAPVPADLASFVAPSHELPKESDDRYPPNGGWWPTRASGIVR